MRTVQFAFDIYDKKSAGYLTTGEMQRAFFNLYGHRKAKKHIDKLLAMPLLHRQIYTNCKIENIYFRLKNGLINPLSVKITLHDFRGICSKHPTLIAPFNDLQV